MQISAKKLSKEFTPLYSFNASAPDTTLDYKRPKNNCTSLMKESNGNIKVTKNSMRHAVLRSQIGNEC